jgi:regulator of cell morphogenesis and NO signaling
MHEEDIVFPYVLAVEEICKTGVISDKNRKVYGSFSILEYQKGHSDIEEKLMDLKIIMIKYLRPPLDVVVYHKIIQLLFMLEQDLNYHSRIEDKVMIPKMISMEKFVSELI